MSKKFRSHFNYANVIATLALFLALGGSAYAATQLPKHSVGSRQLKKNAVTAAKIKRQAVTADKLKDGAITGAKIGGGAIGAAQLQDGAVNAAKVQSGSLTGAQINAATLGTVPTAQLANTIAPPEAWHEVGKPGEVGFGPGWANLGAFSKLVSAEPVAFFKDREGIVHLKGVAKTNGSGEMVFQLPPGYRPRDKRELIFVVPCEECGGTEVSTLQIFGGGLAPEFDGGVSIDAELVSLDGITFRP